MSVFPIVAVLVALATVARPRGARAQTTIYDEPFNDPDGTTSPGDGSWTLARNALTPDIFSVQSSALQLTDASDGGSGGVEFETKAIDISTFSVVDFSVDLSENGDHEASDFVDVAYSTDGGGTFTTITDWNGNGSSAHTLVGNEPDDFDWGSTTVTQGGLSGSELVIRITMRNNGSTEEIRLDDVTVTSAPTVRFTAATGTVSEQEGATTLSVEILDPPSGKAVSAEVAFSGGGSNPASSSDVGGFGTKSVTFPAGVNDGETRSVTVSLAKDGTAEGSETAVFNLQNVSGGSATTGSPTRFTLTVQDAVSNHGGDVLITEIMQNPDAVSDGAGEYLELYNATGSPISLSGWSLEDGDGDRDRLGRTVPARGFVVLCENGDATSNGGLRKCDFDYANRIDFENGGDLIRLLDGKATEVDRVRYDGGTNWPDPSGAAMVFTGTTGNNTGDNWTTAARRERGFALDRSGDAGSPGRNGDGQVLQPSAEVTGAAGWRMLSAPMGGVDADALARVNLVQGVDGHFPNADANLYQWSGGSNAGWSVPSSTDDLTGGGAPTGGAGGFIWYFFDTAKTEFTDPPPFTLSLPGVLRAPNNVTAGGLNSTRTFHLLGNPYAQSFDISALNLSGQGFSTTVQVWNPDTGSYENVTQSPGASDLIGPYQGFFVERSTGSSAQLTFRARGRRADPISLKNSEESPPRIEFRLVGRTAEGTVHTRDEALALYAPAGATTGWDVHDASKLTPLSGRYATAAFLGTRNGNPRPKAVVSIPPTLPEDGIDLPLSVTTRGADAVETFTLTWPTWRQVPEQWSLTLHDTVRDSTVDLRAHTSYSFSLSLSKTQGKPTSRSPLQLPEQLRAKAESGRARFVLTVRAPSRSGRLADFAAAVTNTIAVLRWAATGTTNSTGFYVEHRGPAAQRFRVLDYVKEEGTTGPPRRYRYRTASLEPGRHAFRLRQRGKGGAKIYSDTVSVTIQLDRAVQVQVAPSPVRGTATVTLRVQKKQRVRVMLYDALGRRVRVLSQGRIEPNQLHTLRLQAGGLASGLYFLRVTGERFQETRRVTVVR